MKNIRHKGIEVFQQLFPEKGRTILFLLVTLLAVWLLSLWRSHPLPVASLPRPGFQEKEQKTELTYEYRGREIFTDRLSISLRKKQDDSRQVQQKLIKTAEDFKYIFLNSRRLAKIDKSFYLPAYWRETQINYIFEPENLFCENGDWNYFELFDQQSGREIKITVILRHGAEQFSFTETLKLEERAFTKEYIGELLHRQLSQDVEKKQLQNSQELVLPQQFAGGKVRWQRGGNQVSAGQMAGLLLLLAVILSFLSRTAAQERKKQQQNWYLRDFTQMLHHLVLLLKCGRAPYSAILEVCQKTGHFGNEFRKAAEICCQKLYHQESMSMAIAIFYQQCLLPEIKRFEQLFLMAYERGDEWSIRYLEEFRDELFAGRLRRANETMQKASARLVFPMLLFLIVIVILTIVPAFEQQL
ncbi:hypothetical protein EII17_08440 [Clostridiales bacterium COT073_COT-073]|nr:hypothetical protein EII17_08440 [Clostridiales bacterium COT073_COT-073]